MFRQLFTDRSVLPSQSTVIDDPVLTNPHGRRCLPYPCLVWKPDQFSTRGVKEVLLKETSTFTLKLFEDSIEVSYRSDKGESEILNQEETSVLLVLLLERVKECRTTLPELRTTGL